MCPSSAKFTRPIGTVRMAVVDRGRHSTLVDSCWLHYSPAFEGMCATVATNDHWQKSAGAWIAWLGESGDWARRNVIDPALASHLVLGNFRGALDVGCGEGRLCRLLNQQNISTIGIDPASALIEEARRRDPAGDYRVGVAEALPFDDAYFDLVVSCLSLVDIEDIDKAIAEMVRVLQPGGTLLVVNLASLNTAGADLGWRKDALGRKSYFPIDRYLTDRSYEIEFSGVKIVNWHRPLSRYMKVFLDQGLLLRDFEEPEPIDPNDPRTADYRRAPWFCLMRWQKPKTVRETD